MNTLQINKYITLNGGSETVMSNITSILTSKGHKVSNIGYHKPNQNKIDYSIDLGPENLSIKSFFYNKKIVEKIVTEINKKEIALVIFHNVYHHFPIYQLISEIKKIGGVKTLLYLHDYKAICPTYTLLQDGVPCEICSSGNYYNCILKKCKNKSLLQSIALSFDSYYNTKIKDVYSKFDIIISPSVFLKNKFKEHGFKNDINLLGNPIVINSKRANNSLTHKSILYAGRLSKEKGIDVLLEVAREYDSITFYIAGSGNNSEKLKEKYKSKNVIFLGQLSKAELQYYFDKSSYLIIPSICYENNPMIVLEAMNYGIPVIGSDIGGIPELVKGNGFLFEPGNIQSMKETIEQAFLISEKEYAELSKHAFEFSKQFDSEIYYQKLINIFQDKL